METRFDSISRMAITFTERLRIFEQSSYMDSTVDFETHGLTYYRPFDHVWLTNTIADRVEEDINYAISNDH